MKKILPFILIILILSSCGSVGNNQTDSEGDGIFPQNEYEPSDLPSENGGISENESKSESETKTELNETENESNESSETESNESNETETESETATETNEESEPETAEERLSALPIKIVDEEIDWNGEWNKPKVEFDEIVPGLVSQNVYVGFDGWMFFGDTIKDFTGFIPYTESRLSKIATQMTDRLNWLEENGIALYFVIAPNKNSVYPEFMATEGVEMATERAIDIIIDYLRENTNIHVIDCRDGLSLAKEAYPDELLYYKLDTHWNNHGGFAAYSQIMDEIILDFPNAVKYSKEDYQIDYFESYMKDETYYLGWYDSFYEEGPVYTLKNGLTAKMTYRKDSGPYGQYIHAYIHEDGYRDKTDYCSFVNEHIKDAPTLYMVRDSFAISLLPFLKDSFSESTFSWTLGFDRADILSKKPDIVILQVVERSLNDFFNQKTFR